jgi:hypothetical protein
MKKLATLSNTRHSRTLVVPIGMVLRREQRKALEGLYRRLVTCQFSDPEDSRPLQLIALRSPVLFQPGVLPSSMALVGDLAGKASESSSCVDR